MGTGVTELKREVMLREWSARIAECRGSGKAVKEWCAEQDMPWDERIQEIVPPTTPKKQPALRNGRQAVAVDCTQGLGAERFTRGCPPGSRRRCSGPRSEHSCSSAR